MAAAAAGCAAHQGPALTPDEIAHIDAQKERLLEIRDQIRDARLVTHQTPGPSTSTAPQSQEHGGVRATVAPVSAEDQPWNLWPDGTARLFNDGVGYLWSVEIDAPSPARWSAKDTRLAVNDTELVFLPLTTPDLILEHLVQGARIEEAFGFPGDLARRMDASGGFRSAYLDEAPVKGSHAGVVLFPAPATDLHAMAMQLTLGVQVQGEGLQEFVFLFE